ncbi:MAG TPA: hypothetical protein VHG28_18460, partial [Longimicrobiaceae bacterium]|nr:hypothetical protein [Longimicrobiaceae bacterium]
EGVLTNLAHPVSVTVPPRLVTVGTPAKLIGTGDDVEPADVVAPPEATPPYSALGNGTAAAVGSRSALGELEQRFPFVVATLPGVESAQTVAVLSPERPVIVVARAGKVTRTELRGTVEICEQMGVPVAGIVLQPAGRDGRVA